MRGGYCIHQTDRRFLNSYYFRLNFSSTRRFEPSLKFKKIYKCHVKCKYVIYYYVRHYLTFIYPIDFRCPNVCQIVIDRCEFFLQLKICLDEKNLKFSLLLFKLHQICRSSRCHWMWNICELDTRRANPVPHWAIRR